MKHWYTSEQINFNIQFVQTYPIKKVKKRTNVYIKQFFDRFGINLTYNAAYKVLNQYDKRSVSYTTYMLKILLSLNCHFF